MSWSRVASGFLFLSAAFAFAYAWLFFLLGQPYQSAITAGCILGLSGGALRLSTR